jgi:hypothetical protein
MYLPVFGCKCMVKNKKEMLGKFETRSIEGIFVGYAEDSHGYRYYKKSNGCVKISCDVVFFENNGSQAEQVVPSDVGDEDSSQVSRLWGLGIYFPSRPITSRKRTFCMRLPGASVPVGLRTGTNVLFSTGSNGTDPVSAAVTSLPVRFGPLVPIGGYNRY